MQLLFANNAATALQNGITNVTTTIQVVAGTGALFPAPTTNQGFFITLLDAETQQVREIMECTARVGDVFTVIRGAQGTTALTWDAGDIVSQLNTAGDMQGMVQPDTLQKNFWGVATSVGGSVNNITATLPSGLDALSDGMLFLFFASGANTGTVNLTLTLGSTVLPNEPVQKYGASNLNAGDIPRAGFPVLLVWSADLAAFIMVNPASGTAGSIAGGLANELLVQTSPGTTGFVAAPTVAGTVLAWTGSALAWLAAAVTSFNGRAGAVVPQTGDYTAAQVGAVPASSFQAPNVSLANPGFSGVPGGLITQAGHQSMASNVATAIAFGKIYPNQCLAVVVSCDNQAAAIGVSARTTAGFVCRVNADDISWISIGF